MAFKLDFLTSISKASTPVLPVAPAAPSVALQADTADVTDFVTSNGTLNVTGLEVGATWQYTLDGIAWLPGNGGNPATAATGTFSAPHGSYADGVIQVRQTNSAGQTSPAGVFLFSGAAAPVIRLDGQGGQDNRPQIASLTDGGYAISWAGHNANNSIRDIFVQRYASDNAPLAAPFKLDPIGIRDEMPQITAMDDGGYVLTWQTSGATAASPRDVFVQRFDSSNAPMGAVQQLDPLGGFDSSPRIVTLAGGDYVVAWQTTGPSNSLPRDVMVQRFSENNSGSWPAIQLDAVGGTDNLPAISAMPDGGYVISWVSTGTGTVGGGDLFIQRFGSDNTEQGPRHQIDGMSGTESTPQITSLSGGGYVVTWQGMSGDGMQDAVFVQYVVNNNAQGQRHQFDALGGIDQNARISALPGGGFVVVWDAMTPDGQVWNSYVQRFDSNGGAQGTRHQMFADLGCNVFEPAVTALDDGGYVVVCRAERTDLSFTDLVVQRFDAAGLLKPRIQIPGNFQQAKAWPVVRGLDDGGFVLTWSESSDVYVQRFDVHGRLWMDNIPPLVVDTDSPTAPVVNALSTSSTTPTITGAATLLVGESLTVVVNGATYNNVAVDGGGQWSIDTSAAVPTSGTLGAFVAGQSYNVTATATDTAGNTASHTNSVTIT